MGTQLAIPDLKGWGVCLALSEARLARSDFSLTLAHRFEIDNEDGKPRQPWVLEGKAQHLEIQVVPDGRDLVRLRFALDGTLSVDGTRWTFDHACWDVVTGFVVRRKGSSCDIVADLADPRRTDDLKVTGVDTIDLQLALRRWIDTEGPGTEIRLLRFNTRAGDVAGAKFSHFQVTTAYAEISSVHSSFLLLMSDAAKKPTAEPPIVDPHVLPQGETAVLWIGTPTLERYSGKAVADAAALNLTLRQRHLDLDIRGVTDALTLWTRSVVDNVDLPAPLTFTSMQMGTGGLKLSATPLSLDELENLTPNDLTVSRENLIEQRARDLLSDCALFYLDEPYRKHLLGVDIPTLAPEVKALAEPHQAWLRDLARLQIALYAKRSSRGDAAPYTRLTLASVEKKLGALGRSQSCRDLIEALYPLAFCIVRPRLSLYMDQADEWLPKYRKHLARTEYVDFLLTLKEPVARIHDDAAKLKLFDDEGRAVQSFIDDTTTAFLTRHADKNWKTVLGTYPKPFAQALERILAGLDTRTPPQAEHWIRQAGGAQSVAGHLFPALSDEAAKPQVAPLKDLMSTLARSMHWLGESALATLLFATGAATVATILGPSQALAANGSIAEPQFFVNEIADMFVTGALSASTDGLAPTTFAKVAIGLTGGVRWVFQTISKSAWENTQRTLAEILNDAETFFKTPAGYCFRVAGAVLALVAAGLSLYDMYKHIKEGHVLEAVLDGISALLSLLSFLAIVCVPEGPLGAIVMVLAIITAALTFIFKMSRKSDADVAAEQLVADIEAMSTP